MSYSNGSKITVLKCKRCDSEVFIGCPKSRVKSIRCPKCGTLSSQDFKVLFKPEGKKRIKELLARKGIPCGVVGFQSIRSDAPVETRERQKRILDKLLTNGDME